MPGANDDMSTGELGRRLADLQGQMKDGFAQVYRAIEALSYVHVDRYSAERQADHDRLARAEQRLDQKDSNERWLWRSIVIAIVLPLVVAAIPLIFSYRGGG